MSGVPGNQKTVMTEELYEQICLQVEKSEDSAGKAAGRFGVCWENFRKFKEADENRIARYARAKQAQIEWMLDNMHALEDKMIEECKDNAKVSNALATAYRTKIDNIKWIASKLQPHKWGDKVEVTSRIVNDSVIVRGDDGNPIVTLRTQPKEIKQGNVA